MLALILLVPIVIWLFAMRAVKQRQIAAHQAFLAGLAPGDRVTTTGGILGTVRSIEDGVCRLEIAPGVVMEIVPVVINRRVVEPTPTEGEGGETLAARSPSERGAADRGTAPGDVDLTDVAISSDAAVPTDDDVRLDKD